MTEVDERINRAQDSLDAWIDRLDKAAEAALLEPGCPTIPARTGWDGCE